MRTFTEYWGIALGIIAPTVELSTRMCSGMFFDPLPTMAHVVLFYLLPISVLIARIIVLRPYNAAANRVAMVCISYALVLSTAYSIWFLPISWISFLGTIFMGIGLLGLAPFFLLFASISVFRRWQSWIPADKPSGYRTRPAKFVFLVIPVLLVIWWNPIWMGIGQSLLKSENVSKQYAGLWTLHNLVSKTELMRGCFKTGPRFFNIFSYDTQALRQAYYFSYGQRPGRVSNGETAFGAPRWTFDADVGGKNIGRYREGLSLAESALDGIVRTENGYGYYEWTMVFENANSWPEEARAAVQLPEYSVVSKVSLWIDGEERDAAFGATSQVRSAYQSVVRVRRDPLLVTMIGPDQVQLQCFPISANASMKIRMGVTCPLKDGNQLMLPRFIETNFKVPERLVHNVWIEGDAPGHTMLAGKLAEDTSTILSLSNEQLNSTKTYFEYDVKPRLAYHSADKNVTLQAISKVTPGVAPVLLIDARDDVMAAIKSVDWDAMKFAEVLVAEPFGYEVWDKKQDIGNFVSGQSTFGGVNPCPALNAAVRLARPGAASVIWLHGPLPTAVIDELSFEQVARRSDHPIKVTTVAVGDGLNCLISDVAYMRYFQPQATTGDIQHDLVAATENASRNIEIADDQYPLGGRASSGLAFRASGEPEASHLSRLYLYSRVMQSWYDKGEVTDDLVSQAVNMHIVTPVSGAVVLETQAQYDRANLNPSTGSENVPKIPEPEFYVLLAVSVLVMIIIYRRKRPFRCTVSR